MSANGHDVADNLIGAQEQAAQEHNPMIQIVKELDARVHERVTREMAAGTMPLGRLALNTIIAMRDEAAQALLAQSLQSVGTMQMIYGIMRALKVDKVEVSPAEYLVMDQHIIARDDKQAGTEGNMCFVILDKKMVQEKAN